MNTLELEVMPPEVAAVSTELSTTKETALAAFTPFQKLFAESAQLLAREKEAVTTAQARELRLAMKKHRSASKATKDNVKADILLAGRLADAYFNRITGPLENAEGRLDDIEKAEERRIAEEKSALNSARSTELRSVGVDPQFFPLGDMPETAYGQLLASSKLAHETKIAAAAKAEADRIEAARVAEVARLAKIEDERVERERIAAENARLKAEREESERLAKIEREKAAAALAAAEESARVERERVAKERAAAEKLAADKLAAQEAQAKKEREAIEAKAKSEREAAAEVARVEREKRERLERAEHERVAAEQKRQEAEALAARRAASAPDKQKLCAFADLVETLEIPEMSTKAGKVERAAIVELLSEFVADIRAKSARL